MAEKDIIQNLISQLGQSQGDRLPRELESHFVDVDERTAKDLLLYAKRFAAGVAFHPRASGSTPGDWTTFFPDDATALDPLLAVRDGSVTPHLALFLAFLELCRQPQAILNRFTDRHLDFYYQEVLRLKRRAAVPDKVHVLLELSKQAPPVSLTPQNAFTAGKDGSGAEVLYVPTGTTVLRHARVESLRSIFLDSRGHGTVRQAPVANSADGVGGEFKDVEPRWSGFGHAALPAAEVGFALTSPVLRMREGTRKVTVTLMLSGVNPATLSTATLAGAWEAFITGESAWLGPYALAPTLSSDGVLQFDFTVPASDAAVVNYDAAIHGYAYAARSPVVQVLLKSGQPGIGYSDFAGVTLQRARMAVAVTGIQSLSLEGDGGVLDPKKAFAPFGSQPTAGARFHVGCEEALSKKLSELKLRISWKDAPANFATHYQNYGRSSVNNRSFTAAVAFRDGGGWEYSSSGIGLFNARNASAEQALTFAPGATSATHIASAGGTIRALSLAGNEWAGRKARALIHMRPVLGAFRAAAPEPRAGFITCTLETDFLHATYRQQHVANVMKYSTKEVAALVVLNEPYGPMVQSLSLSYQAHTDTVEVSSTRLEDFAHPDLQFFHVAYFGQMQEHGHQRSQFSFLADRNVSLLPAYRNEGELLIGLSGLKGGDSVSLLFQVAEGSGDPDLEPPDLAWSVLCDNYWKPLERSEVFRDTTQQLLTSGILQFVLPRAATTQNSILPAGYVWLRAGVTRHAAALSQLVTVAANAVEAQRAGAADANLDLASALDPGRIGKLKSGVAGLKAIRQPYASFGGRPVESDTAFRRRVSERLRHKNRCLTPWDYERVVLEAFPQVHKVKCLPHARPGAWLAPGHVLLVVIPDLRLRNAVDVLQPRVDGATLQRIAAHVQERVGAQVQVQVQNPAFQKVRFDFKVRFHAGCEFNFHSTLLNQHLIEFLSPWAFAADRDIAFGGAISKSVVLDFVEERDSVDYVTHFRMSSPGGPTPDLDVNTIRPETPDAILVSDAAHAVRAAD